MSSSFRSSVSRTPRTFSVIPVTPHCSTQLVSSIMTASRAS
nr:MAG TPA: hypothetical protein [Caudoviricetes sp.]